MSILSPMRPVGPDAPADSLRCTTQDKAELPELPEIEHLKRTLEPWLLGARVESCRRLTPSVVRLPTPAPGCPRTVQARLMAGHHIDRLRRHGKQLAIVSRGGPVVCVHLGMTGELRFVPRQNRVPDRRHVHCIWTIRTRDDTPGHLIFRDPRRFGGCWAFDSEADLHEVRWSRLGPDALTITTRNLAKALGRTRRLVKTALLDQSLLAGVGNIYADEALFRARVSPLTPANALDQDQIQRLGRAVRLILRRAIEAGGSTIRDYRDADGRSGTFANRHLVYGRGNQPCVKCGTLLTPLVVGQRSTVYCPVCQAG